MAAGFSATLAARFVSDVMSLFVGGAAQARAKTTKDTSARVFFMMKLLTGCCVCSAAVLCQLLELVKGYKELGNEQHYTPTMVELFPLTIVGAKYFGPDLSP
jgi:hypothetical protein